MMAGQVIGWHCVNRIRKQVNMNCRKLDAFLDGCAERVQWRCPRFLYGFFYTIYWLILGAGVLILVLGVKDGMADTWQAKVFGLAAAGGFMVLGLFGVVVMRRAYRLLKR
jgi:hypothetical protein